MYIAKVKVKGQKKPYYSVMHSYRDNGKIKQEYIGTLGHYSSINRAYRAALADYLKASAKLEKLESIIQHDE